MEILKDFAFLNIEISQSLRTTQTTLPLYAVWLTFSTLADSSSPSLDIYFCCSLKNSLAFPHVALVHIGQRRTFCEEQDLPEPMCSLTSLARPCNDNK